MTITSTEPSSRDLKTFVNEFTSKANKADEEVEMPTEYDVNCLDYAWAAKATNLTEVIGLLKVLKSGKEGFYPELEKAFEDRIAYLDPTRVMPEVKSTPTLEQVKVVSDELVEWLKTVKQSETKLKETKTASAALPPVRKADTASPPKTTDDIFQDDPDSQLENKPGYLSEVPGLEDIPIEVEEQLIPVPAEPPMKSEHKPDTSQKKFSSQSRIKSTDYRSWDRLDVDAEIKRLEEESVSSSTSNSKDNGITKTRINPIKDTDLEIEVDVPPLDQKQAEFLAENEKNKGNEAFKIKDYKEAAAYYTRSLKILPKANVYTNRALAYLKLGSYEKAENDCTEALRLDDPNFKFKAFLRRASAREKRGHYIEAMADLDEALQLAPTNVEAIQMRHQVEKKFRDVEGELANEKLHGTVARGKSGRIQIEEVEEEDVIEEIVTPLGRKSSGAKTTKSVRFFDQAPAESTAPNVGKKWKGKEPATEPLHPVEELEEKEDMAQKLLHSYLKRVEKARANMHGVGSSSGTSSEIKNSDSTLWEGKRFSLAATAEHSPGVSAFSSLAGEMIEIEDVDYDSDDDA